jgi:hypothetical protein
MACAWRACRPSLGDIKAIIGRYRQAAGSAKRLMEVWVGPMDLLKRPEPATA